MLFNSFLFIFLFLPLSVAGFYLCKRLNFRLALAFLVGASLFYYAYWKPVYLVLLLGSIGVNYVLARGMVKSRAAAFTRKSLLVAAIAFNLLLLMYFKYAGFAAETVSFLTGHAAEGFSGIVLPLAISFFTFQQIAYQVDLYKGKVARHNALEYMLFVCFFPQLIAGPIVHHAEMMPQFEQRANRPFMLGNLSVGLTIFILGLFKKTVIADSLSPHVGFVFEAAGQGQTIDFFAAWVAALGYTFQLYFDFSGYSDMAIGGARMFGIRLPCNFFSPYKSTNIIDFWRRWHMTLSRFLRDYLYIPLGGNRCGHVRRLVNVFITMVLGGLWHGAGWTFVLWGALHGVYIVINHLWRMSGQTFLSRHVWMRALSWLVTFVLVVIAWVLFRAESLQAARAVLSGMAGMNGLALPVQLFNYGTVPQGVSDALGISISSAGLWPALYIAGAMGVALLMPNTHQFMVRFRPTILPRYMRSLKALYGLVWRPNIFWALAVFVLFVIALSATFSGSSEFLYYNF